MVREDRIFEVGKEVFDITVDYSKSVARAWEEARKHIVWWGDLEIHERTFPPSYRSQRDFCCRYATLRENNHLWKMEDIFAEERIVPADMMQLFAFTGRHGKREVTVERASPVVAAAPGSTWRCSHGVLREMAGLSWTSFYHKPGLELSTFSQYPQEGFVKGTRFLIIV